jgi:hypothetical protein
MVATLEEHAFVEAELGDKSIAMGVMDPDDERAEDVLLWEAIQHEVLMRNMPGFVS